MLNKIQGLIMLMLLICTVNLFAEKLVLVTLSDAIIISKLEKMNLKVAIQNKEYAVFIVNDESVFNNKLFTYQVLSWDMDENPIYLISSKIENNLSKFVASDKIVWQDRYSLFLKDKNPDLIKLSEHNLKAVKLEKTSKVFNNLKKSYIKDSKSAQRIDQNVLNAINADSLSFFIQHLQDYGTRYALHPNRFQVAEWIRDQYLRFGYTDVVLDSFFVNYAGGYWQKNVIATLPGSELSDQYVYIGGHHDSINNGGYDIAMVSAPGADDNGSGSAAVLETARAMKLVNYLPKTSIRFCTYAMEEFGLYGSKYDAAVASQNLLNIRAMINHDMIASQISDFWNVHLQNYQGSEFLTELAVDYIDQNPLLNYNISYTNTSGSDSWSYWHYGYNSIFLAETEFSPYYHTSNDLIQYCNFPYAKEVVKLGASMLMYMSEVPSLPENFLIRNVGNGSSLRAQWDNITDQGEVIYYISVENQQTQVVNTYTTTQNYYQINSLSAQNSYKISLQAGIGDLRSINQSIITSPESIPQAVLNFTAIPSLAVNHLAWNASNDMDIVNCLIYRKTATQTNPELLLDLSGSATEYIFTPENDTTKYYYAVSMVDNDNNVSELSEFLMVRPITMTHGLLVLDDTYNGNGSLLLPSDAQVDNFYTSILDGYTVSMKETSTTNPFSIFDLAPYSHVIYHRNTSNVNDIVANIDGLKEYLDFGGNLVISSYKASQSFSNIPGYPANFSSGSFVRDYLKIQSSSINSDSRFQYAEALYPGFQDIYIDSTKTHPNLDYRLMNIESITPSSNAVAIYAYQSGLSNDDPLSEMNGLITGVLYNGADYKTLTLSFPLYYMKENQAKALIRKGLLVMGLPNQNDNLENDKVNIARLKANYPNPFNPSTKIPYYLPKAEKVSIKIFNVKGQLLKTCHTGYQTAGNHEINWDGTDNQGKILSSGIYFYSLQLNGKIADVRKMILIK